MRLLLLLLVVGPISLHSQSIDLIMHGGNLITIDEKQPFAQALAIADGIIMQVGSDNDILRLQSRYTKLIDLEGMTVVPGFVDAHNHLYNAVGLEEEVILEQQQLMLENGITSFGQLFADEPVVKLIEGMEEKGLLTVKVNLYLPAANNCGDVLGDWYLQFPPTQTRGEKSRIAGIKIFTDGGSCGKQAATSFIMPGLGHRGDLFFDQATLDQLVQNIDAQGYQLAVHAQGDRGVEQAISALSRVPNVQSKKHRVEHTSFIPHDLVGAYSKYGIVPVVWGEYLTCSIDGLARWLGRNNLLWMEDHRALHDENPGWHIAWHSDAPHFQLSPIYCMHGFVTRGAVRDDVACEAPAWLLEHAITTEEALKTMTIAAAYALDRDEEVGSLEAGKYADMVILSQDILAVEPSSIINTEVLATFVEGELSYCKNPGAAFCRQATSQFKSLQKNTFRVTAQPNPFSDQTTIYFESDEFTTGLIEIFDAQTGQLIMSRKNDLKTGPNKFVWPVGSSNIIPGIYFLRIRTEKRDTLHKLIYAGV